MTEFALPQQDESELNPEHTDPDQPLLPGQYASALLFFPVDYTAASDAELFDRTKQGDSSAYGEFYNRHAGLLRGYLSRRVGDFATADDLASETFIKALTKLQSGASIQFPNRWIYRIAHNFLISHVRIVTNHPDVELEEADSAVEPFDPIELSEESDRLRKALAGVPAHYREVFMLHAYHGFSHAQIARDRGTTEGAVRVMYLRARRKLQSLLIDLHE